MPLHVIFARQIDETIANYLADEGSKVRVVNEFKVRELQGPKWVGKRTRWDYKKEWKFGLDLCNLGGKWVFASSQEDTEDTSFWELGIFDGALKSSFLVDPKSGVAEANVADADGELALARHIWKAWSTDPRFGSLVFAAPPFAARLGDPTMHGTPFLPGLGSPNVLIGGMPALRAGVDTLVCATANPTPHVGGSVPIGASSVVINGFQAVRAGDVIVESGGGPNPIASGCMTVMIGPPAPPVTCEKPLPASDSFITLDLDVLTDLGYAKGSTKMGAKGGADSKDILRLKAEGRASALRVNPRGKLSIQIPGREGWTVIPFDFGINFLTAGGDVEGSSGKAGSYNQKVGWVAWDGGIKVPSEAM